MTVRVVEWKKPYTWGKAIEITEDKVINLRLREENNLIIYDEWDDEIYVDLQLQDWIRPTDAFPVWCNTGRVLVADDWDVTGTLVCFKTTSWDNIKLLYGDDWKLYIDNWTWVFKQIYLKWEVDALIQALRDYVDAQLALKQDKLIAWENIHIASDGKTISAIVPTLSRFLSIWDASTWEPISFPASTPFAYQSWDYYLVENVDTTTNYRPSWSSYDGTASSTVETAEVADWDVYIYDGLIWLLQSNTQKTVAFANIAWDPYDNSNLATALNSKQATLAAWNNIQINWATISATDTTYSAGTGINISGWTISNSWVTSFNWSTWAVTYAAPVTSVNWNTWAVTVNEVPSSWTTGYVLTKTSNGYWWAAAAGGDVQISSQSNNILTSWAKIWAWSQSDYESLWSYDSNTVYLTI